MAIVSQPPADQEKQKIELEVKSVFLPEGVGGFWKQPALPTLLSTEPRVGAQSSLPWGEHQLETFWGPGAEQQMKEESAALLLSRGHPCFSAFKVQKPPGHLVKMHPQVQ